MYDRNDTYTPHAAQVAFQNSIADPDGGKLQRIESQFFGVMADNLPFGLAMFDGAMRMIMCNRAYREMYRLDDDEARSGTSVEEIASARRRVGTGPKREQAGDFIREREQIPVCGELRASDIELHDGRICSIVRQALPGGGWVSLHHDVTEQREGERKVDFLAASF